MAPHSRPVSIRFARNAAKLPIKTRIHGCAKELFSAERRAIATAIHQLLFGASSRRQDREPGVALCGVDDALGRPKLDEVGFISSWKPASARLEVVFGVIVEDVQDRRLSKGIARIQNLTYFSGVTVGQAPADDRHGIDVHILYTILLYNHCRKGEFMIRLNISISDDLAAKLDELSGESQTTESEILRKALTLFDLAREGKRYGKKPAFVGEGGQVTTEIVGLCASSTSTTLRPITVTKSVSIEMKRLPSGWCAWEKTWWSFCWRYFLSGRSTGCTTAPSQARRQPASKRIGRCRSCRAARAAWSGISSASDWLTKLPPVAMAPARGDDGQVVRHRGVSSLESGPCHQASHTIPYARAAARNNA